METTRISGIETPVSRIGLGTWAIGGWMWGGTDDAASIEAIRKALASGINLIDTAPVYGFGHSEEVVGRALEGRRSQAVIATKVALDWPDGKPRRNASAARIRTEIEDSLRRLRTDHIDLYQVHEWDGLSPLEETLEALDTLVRGGKVRYVGVSNFSGWHVMKTLAVSDLQRFIRPASQQIHYTLQAREAENELIPIALDQGLGVLIWSPLAGGLLSGKYRRGHKAPDGTRQLANWGEPPVHDQEKLYDIVEVLVAIAETRSVSAAQVALAWLLGRPAVASVIVGARTEAQLSDNLQAANLILSAEERARLDQVSATPLLYPYWHQANTAADRLSPADLSLLGGHLKH